MRAYLGERLILEEAEDEHLARRAAQVQQPLIQEAFQLGFFQSVLTVGMVHGGHLCSWQPAGAVSSPGRWNRQNGRPCRASRRG